MALWSQCVKVDLEIIENQQNFPRSQFCLNFSKMFAKPIFVLELHFHNDQFQIIENFPRLSLYLQVFYSPFTVA